MAPDPVVRFTLAYNQGAAFSTHFGPYQRWVLIALTLTVLAGLGRLYRRGAHAGWPGVVGLALVAGGAVGNLIDRLSSRLNTSPHTEPRMSSAMPSALGAPTLLLRVAPDAATVIELYEVPQARQYAARAADAVRARWTGQPGFAGAAVFASTDQVRVAVYAQWREPAGAGAPLAAGALPAERSTAATFPELLPPDAHVYDVAFSVVASGAPDPVRVGADGPPVYHLAEFRMPPANQPRMLALAEPEAHQAIGTPGLLSATFHRGRDGARVINLGQWRDEQAIQTLMQRPGFSTSDGTGYWTGLAENQFHLYRLAAVIGPAADPADARS